MSAIIEFLRQLREEILAEEVRFRYVAKLADGLPGRAHMELAAMIMSALSSAIQRALEKTLLR